MEYKLIVYRQDIFKLIEQYPIISKILLTSNDEFSCQQLNNLTIDNDYLNEYIYQRLCLNNNYHRLNNHHLIKNELLNITLECIIEHHIITIIAPDKRNIFFDIIYQKSKNYVIMLE